MKKLLLIFVLAIFATGITAQTNLMFKDLGGTDVSGDTIHAAGDTSQYEVLVTLIVRNNGAAACSVKVKRYILNEVPGSANLICWVLCWSEATNESPQAMNIPANSETSGEFNFVGHYRPHNLPGSTKVMYVAYDVANVNDSISVVISYDIPGPSGISNSVASYRSISNPVPNPASGFTRFSYSMEPGAVGKIGIYNLTGTLVKRIELPELSGSIKIETADLPSGLYFYSYEINGKKIKTNKLIVNH